MNTPQNDARKLRGSEPSPSRTAANTDPILLELWEIKRQINAEAHFDIAKLAAQANQFDLEKALQKLSAAH